MSSENALASTFVMAQGVFTKSSNLEKNLFVMSGLVHFMNVESHSNSLSSGYCIVANPPGFTGSLPSFIAFPGSRPVYTFAIASPGIVT